MALDFAFDWKNIQREKKEEKRYNVFHFIGVRTKEQTIATKSASTRIQNSRLQERTDGEFIYGFCGVRNWKTVK